MKYLVVLFVALSFNSLALAGACSAEAYRAAVGDFRSEFGLVGPKSDVWSTEIREANGSENEEYTITLAHHDGDEKTYSVRMNKSNCSRVIAVESSACEAEAYALAVEKFRARYDLVGPASDIWSNEVSIRSESRDSIEYAFELSHENGAFGSYVIRMNKASCK